MTGVALLSGQNVKHAEIHVPVTGLWHLDVALQDATDLGTVAREFTFQNLKLECAVLRSINFAGERGLRLVAGKGTWRTVIPPRQYASPAHVMLSTVIQDAASLVGEPAPTITNDVQLGTGYVRSQGPASRVLDLLPFWWTDFTGVVQDAARVATPITSTFTVMDVDRAAGKVTIATDALEDWTPGRSFQTQVFSATVNRVMHVIDGGQVRTYAFTPDLVAGTVAS